MIKLKKCLKLLLPFAFWMAVWQIFAIVIDSELFLPSPYLVFKALIRLIVSSDFWLAVIISLADILIGCIFGIFVALLFSLLSCKFGVVRDIVSPAVSVIRAVPVASFIILVYVLVRRLSLAINFVSIVIVALMVIPIVWNGVMTAYRNLDKNLLEVGKVFSFTPIKRFTIIYLPSAKHTILGAISSSIGLAWKAGIAAEVICRPENTVGKYIGDFKSTLEMDAMFAMTIVIIILSLMLEKSVKWLADFLKGGKKYDSCLYAVQKL